MNIARKQFIKFKKLPFDHQINLLMFPLTLLANLLMVGYCTFIAKLPMDYTLIQLTWLTFFTILITVTTEILFHFIVTKPLSNSFAYWESKELTAKERSEILEQTGSYPIKKAYELIFIFLMLGAIYYLASHYLLNIDTHISLFNFQLYISLAYIYVLISIFILEKKCSKFAIKIANQEIDLTNKKFFGLSQRSNFIIYLVIPIVGTAFLITHAVFYTFHSQTVHSMTGTMTSRSLSEMETLGLFIKTNLTRPEALQFVIKMSISNAFFVCMMIIFYYVKILNSTKLMQNSLVMLKDNKVNHNRLSNANIFSEDFYTMYLINRTILLFDSIIRNNTKTNKDIDGISRMLSEISTKTTQNVVKQSANIEETLATMQSVDNLSKKIETNFDEVITVASKTMDSVDKTFVDLKQNYDKIREITDTNRVTIDNLTKLSDKISGIRDAINSIDKFAEQTKTVAFNAELEANNIDIEGIDFTNVAEEIRKLSNNILDLTKDIHSQITDISTASEEIIQTGNYCMSKTKEGDEICTLLGEKFDEIKQSAKATSLSSSNIKESLHQQTNSFHQIVETLSQIAKSVRNFGNSSASIAETIENLRQSSSHILDLNNNYNSKDNTQEGDAL